jgi:prepilin-type N-terminal cleavage/methylation domain-containing protein
MRTAHARAGNVRIARRGLRARGGFTLPELLVAMVILTIGVLFMVGIIGNGIRWQSAATARTEMTTLAEGKIEELRAYGMARSTDPLRARVALGGSLTSDVTGYVDAVDGPAGRRFGRRWEITSDIAGARRVAVRVIPLSPAAGETPLELTTLVALR